MSDNEIDMASVNEAPAKDVDTDTATDAIDTDAQMMEDDTPSWDEETAAPARIDRLSDYERGVEAALFAAQGPLSLLDIATYVGENDALRDVLNAIATRHAGTGIELVERGGRWHFQTPADLAHLLRREREEPKRMSRAAMEVLAIIAYHEPVSRAEIEAIRGVQTAKGTLDVLMEAGWIRPAGRREVPGRPLLYKTTIEFLAHFGLTSRRDLPGLADLKAAGLLDPVDEAYERLELAGNNADATAADQGDELTETAMDMTDEASVDMDADLERDVADDATVVDDGNDLANADDKA